MFARYTLLEFAGMLGLLGAMGALVWKAIIATVGWIRSKALEDVRRTGISFFGIKDLTEAMALIQAQLKPNGGQSLVDQVALLFVEIEEIRAMAQELRVEVSALHARLEQEVSVG